MKALLAIDTAGMLGDDLFDQVSTREALDLRIDQLHGFDRDFQSTLKIAGDKERSSAMRARWRNVESLPEHPPGKAPVVVHVILGVLIALAVIAMYQPIFKLGATL